MSSSLTVSGHRLVVAVSMALMVLLCSCAAIHKSMSEPSEPGVKEGWYVDGECVGTLYKENPVNGPEGYARVGYAYQANSGKLKSEQFFGPDGAPVPVTCHGVSGTVEAEYSYLQGVGEVVYVVLYGNDRQVLGKKKLSGNVYEHIRRVDYHYSR